MDSNNGVCLIFPARLVAVVVVATALAGCAIRTLPPLRYVPVLGAEKKVRTTTVLARALGDPDPAVRAQAVELLGVMARGPDKGLRRAAVSALGTATRDAEPGVRVLALEELGQADPALANKYLLRALQDPHLFVRKKVLEVMQRRQQRAKSPPSQSAGKEAAAAGS